LLDEIDKWLGILVESEDKLDALIGVEEDSR